MGGGSSVLMDSFGLIQKAGLRGRAVVGGEGNGWRGDGGGYFSVTLPKASPMES